MVNVQYNLFIHYFQYYFIDIANTLTYIMYDNTNLDTLFEI